MRRSDKEILDKELIDSILKKELVCRIAMNDDGNPYLVPMIFGYQDNCLFLHSAKEGRKIDILKKNNRICFEVESNVELVPAESACNWSFKYYCIIGYGNASFIEDMAEKKELMNIIMEKGSGKNSWDFPEAALEKTAIIKIEITAMTGKKSQL
jgi:uncharacterized protein